MCAQMRIPSDRRILKIAVEPLSPRMRFSVVFCGFCSSTKRRSARALGVSVARRLKSNLQHVYMPHMRCSNHVT